MTERLSEERRARLQDYHDEIIDLIEEAMRKQELYRDLEEKQQETLDRLTDELETVMSELFDVEYEDD